MTKAELVAFLSDFPDDTPILDGKHFDLQPHHLGETVYDDWQHSTSEVIDGATYETPARGRAIRIGSRF